MSIGVISTSTAIVPDIVATVNSNTSGQINSRNIFTAPGTSGQSIFCRVSCFISVSSGATGQSIILSLTATDSNGISTMFSSPSIGPGENSSFSGLLSVDGGTSISFTTEPSGSNIFVSQYNYQISVETL